jgi:hypothetical protein
MRQPAAEQCKPSARKISTYPLVLKLFLDPIENHDIKFMQMWLTLSLTRQLQPCLCKWRWLIASNQNNWKLNLNPQCFIKCMGEISNTVWLQLVFGCEEIRGNVAVFLWWTRHGDGDGADWGVDAWGRRSENADRHQLTWQVLPNKLVLILKFIFWPNSVPSVKKRAWTSVTRPLWWWIAAKKKIPSCLMIWFLRPINRYWYED